MKKMFVAFLVLLMWPVLWAGSENEITIAPNSVLTSTGDSAVAWTSSSAGYQSTTLATDVNIFNYRTATVAGTFALIAEAKEPQKRYVSVWIIDQDEDIPLAKSILYERPMFFTDQTPDEVRAGILLLELLKKHNEYRGSLKDKEGKPLKKIRLRDLQIVIRNW